MTSPTSLPPGELGTGVTAYLRLLSYPPASIPFLTAVLARLSISMAPLGLLLLVESVRNAYATAGLVTGAFAVGCALGTPLWGRMMDRFGQVRTLLPTALTSASFLAAAALATVGGAPIWLVIVFAGIAGLSYPPVSPAIRAGWRVIFPNPASRRVAFALDATAVELLFVGGPLLLSGLLWLTAPVVPLLVTAGCMVIGAVGYCRTAAARRSRPMQVKTPAAERQGMNAGAGSEPQYRSALMVPGVAMTLLVVVGLSVGFGQLDTSLAAAAEVLLGSNEKLGIMFAAIAGGSGVGGLLYGSRDWPLAEHRRMPIVAGAFATQLVVISLLMATGAPPLWVLLPLLFSTGLTIAPVLIMLQSMVDRLTPASRLNEAQSMFSAVNMTGAAIGTAVAGLVIDHQGVTWSFAGAALGVGCCALASLISQRRWTEILAGDREVEARV